MARIRRQRDGRALMTGVSSVWAAVIATFLLWQIVQYRGLMAFLAEWQFNFLGRYYPSLTYVALVALLASPAIVIFLKVRRRHSEQRLAAATLRSALVFRRVVYSIAALCSVAAIITLLMLLVLPRGAGEPHNIDLAQPAVALPAEGPTTINGTILFDRTAAFDKKWFFTRHDMRFAPVVAPGAIATDLQFFIELPPESAARPSAGVSMTGILKKDALPGEIIQLYRYAGYRVEAPYYVLFSDEASMRRPYLETAAQLAICAILFLAIGLWQHRRVKWIKGRAVKTNTA